MKEYIKPEIELVVFTSESIALGDTGIEDAPSGW